MTQIDTQTLVSFSLTVLSGHRIEELEPFAGRTFVSGPDEDHFYSIYKSDFVGDEWDERSDRLHQMASDALDLLDATDISPSELHHPDVRVRAFYTFEPGSETLQAEDVKRLARINATIWIDANA